METQQDAKEKPIFGAAEIGALAHLYRGEMYQSKIWRGRLDTTTNWAVVITGIALSATFTDVNASPMPILLVSWVVVAFLLFEARRYLFYDVFRVRVRVMEINFYGPLLRGEGVRVDIELVPLRGARREHAIAGPRERVSDQVEADGAVADAGRRKGDGTIATHTRAPR